MSDAGTRAELFTQYPLSSVLIYNGATLLHFTLGGIGIALGYSFSSWAGISIGALYLVFALVEMYVMMPLKVCPNCVYYRMPDSRCISGLNQVSKRVAREGDPKAFAKRGQGLLCNNNLYMAALILPILGMIPALFLNFSIWLLVIFLAVVGLLLFRFFVIFTKIACIHCYAKYKCPQAGQMGVRDM